jgi:hypothetical protein
MIKLNCPHCATAINAADEHAGKKVRCPACKGVLAVPGAAGPAPSPQAVRPPAAASRTTRPVRPEPAGPPAITPAPPDRPYPAPRRRPTQADEEVVELEPVGEEEEEEPDRPRRRRRSRGPRTRYADCPECGAPGDAERVSFTWWGGMLGPAMFNHVRCNECGTAYNGRTGNYNTTAITIYTLVSLGLTAVIVALFIVLQFRVR